MIFPTVQSVERYDNVPASIAAALAKFFRARRYTTRLPSGEIHGRQPSDTRSSGRRPFSPSCSEHFDIRHDCLPAGSRYSQSPSARGLLEPYGQARGFFGEHHWTPPSPLQCRIDTISGSFLSAIENWSEACHENCAAPTGLIIHRRMWNYGLRHIRLVWANVRYIPYINPM